MISPLPWSALGAATGYLFRALFSVSDTSRDAANGQPTRRMNLPIQSIKTARISRRHTSRARLGFEEIEQQIAHRTSGRVLVETINITRGVKRFLLGQDPFCHYISIICSLLKLVALATSRHCRPSNRTTLFANPIADSYRQHGFYIKLLYR